MTRVVVLDHTAALGGAELALLRLLTHLDHSRFEVTAVLFSDGSLRARLESAGVTTILLPLDAAVARASRHDLLRPGGTARATKALCTHARALRRLLQELAPELVVANSLKSGVIGGSVARSLRLPFVWHLHDRLASDYLPQPAATAMRALVRHLPAHVVVNSRATLETIAPVPHDCVTVAYPGLERSAFELSARRVRDVPVVGILGRISPTKGQNVFLHAAARVGLPANYRIIGAPLFGEESYAARLRVLAHDLGLTPCVEFAGWTDDPAAALRDLDVLVHASPVPEPFGQVVVEAMAAGVPVIATASGGVPEILHDPASPDAELGRLVPPDDPAALADAIIRTLAHPAAAQRRADAAWRSAQERFAIERTARLVEAVWTTAARRDTVPKRRSAPLQPAT